MMRVCGFCGKVGGDKNSNTPMMVCGKCKSMNYCNRDCQVQHWPVHKGPCRITTETMKGKTSQHPKRLLRLLSSWATIAPHPLESLLELYYGTDRLDNEILNKKVIEIDVVFDYNRRTFVPKCPPQLLNINTYRRDHPEHDMSNPKVVWQSVQLRNANNQGVHYIRGAAMIEFYIAFCRTTVRRGSWDEIVEQVFPYSPRPALSDALNDFVEIIRPEYNQLPTPSLSLHSSIFRDESWETMKHSNLDSQFELVRQSPHYGHFIGNALYIKTLCPRYKTHVIMVHVTLGMGLGQWSQLKDYQVLSLDEAKQFLRERRTTAPPSTSFDHIERELLELEKSQSTTHPENTNTDIMIRVPILFDVQVDGLVMMKPIMFRIANNAVMNTCLSVCDTKARKLFDKLKATVSFPVVVSPNMH